mmetsp:Transcript_2828/g.4650  ORF Transcript_2828/g.4650 Transcript_2828/m.4650 type:complete len:250 (-) Transcript_2828:27-776(-)
MFGWMACLDALREVVASLAVVVRGVERATNLLDDALAREDALPPDTEGSEHGQAAVLDLLELLLLVLLLRVFETERVEATLAKADIARGVVALDALLEALGLKSADEDGDLHKAPLRHRTHGGESVQLAEVVGGVRREMVDVREDETKPRELGDAAVLELRLTVPLDRLERHVLGVHGEAERVEADVADHRAVERGRGRRERQGLGAHAHCRGGGRGGLAALGHHRRGLVGRSRSHEGEHASNRLHGLV